MNYRVVILTLVLCAATFAGNATDIVDKSEVLYSKSGPFSAKFTQTVSTGDFFDDEKVEGTLIMNYPRQFRIDTREQVIVSDGDTLWSYSAENRQVTVEAVSKSKESITPADYLFNFKQNYNLDYDSTDVIDKVKVRRLSLRSKSQDQYVRSMKVYINSSTFQIRRVVYRDLNDNKITLDFSDWKMGIKTTRDQFRFKPPRGVEEVRLP
jgi:outer membrane lipoprotein carrier protein